MQAYGPHGLGILSIAGIPGLPEMRRRLLPLSTQFVVRPWLGLWLCFWHAHLHLAPESKVGYRTHAKEKHRSCSGVL